MKKTDKLRWKIRAEFPAYRRHVDCAVDAIHRAHESARMSISWSGGKDSTAMAHLVKSLYPDTPIIVQFDDCDWPGKQAYIDRICEAHGWTIHRVEPAFSVWDQMKRGDIGDENFWAKSHALTREGFLKPLDAKRQELDCNGVYIGLRADESKARAINYRARRDVYQLKDGTWHCCPMARWTAEDVFAYLTRNNIEINPYYLNNRILAPEQIRLSWAVPCSFSQGNSQSDMESLRRNFPDRFRILRERGVRY